MVKSQQTIQLVIYRLRLEMMAMELSSQVGMKRQKKFQLEIFLMILQ